MEKQQEVKTITCFSQFEKEKENLDSSPFIATFFEYLSESDEELLSILFFKNTFHFIYSFFFLKKFFWILLMRMIMLCFLLVAIGINLQKHSNFISFQNDFQMYIFLNINLYFFKIKIFVSIMKNKGKDCDYWGYWEIKFETSA